jgi:predicted membrane protein
MERRAAVLPTPQLVVGIVVVILGVLFTLDNLGVLNSGDYLRFWPLALFAIGLAKFVDATGAPGRVIGGVLMLLGGLLLLNNLELIRFRFRDYWPLILVFFGISIIWQAFVRHQRTAADSTLTVSGLAILGGVQKTCRSLDFRGGELTAILGGCEIDLRPAVMQVDEAVVQTFAFWGGIEMKVPEDWDVVCKGYPILGGFEDRTSGPQNGVRKRLIVKGFAIMGGVEIRN